jgi:hypothetical protein
MSDGASEPIGTRLRLAGDEMLEAISAKMLALYGDQYHPAPRRARTYLNDERPHLRARGGPAQPGGD